MNKTQWLASVQSLVEAQSLADCLPDMLDMKQPAEGALGALPVAEVTAIVDWVAGRCQTSATVGDLPMDKKIIAPALEQMAATGVDFVKLGLFGGDSQSACLQQLTLVLSQLSTPAIAVMFADRQYQPETLEQVIGAGFKGVMIDTADKNGKSLLDLWTAEQTRVFVEQVKQAGLLCGLAGALRVEDIPTLRAAKPDYLGFRSALCPERKRKHTLSLGLAKYIQLALQ